MSEDPPGSSARIAASIQGARLALAREAFEASIALTHSAAKELGEGEGARAQRAELLVLRGAAEVGLVRAGRIEALHAAATLAEAAREAPAGGSALLFALLHLVELDIQSGAFGRAASGLEEVEEAVRSSKLPDESPLAVGADLQRTTLAVRLAIARSAPAEELEGRRAELEAALERFLVTRADLAPLRSATPGLVLARTPRAAISEAIRVTLRLEGSEHGAWESFELLLRVQAHGPFERATGLGPATIEELRSDLLEEHRGFLVFLPAAGHSFVFALEKHWLHAYELPGTDALGPLRDSWDRARFELGGGSDDAESAAGEEALARELAAKLLPDAIQRQLAKWRGATLVGADPWRLPIGDLLLASGARLSSLSIDDLPSLAWGLAAARRSGERESPVFERARFLAPRVSPKVAERWPETAEAWDLPTTPTADPRTEVRSGDAATATALLTVDRGQARMLEVVAHGVLDLEQEEPVRLVMSPDATDSAGLVTAERIRAAYPIGNAPELVVLAARRADQGRQQPKGGSMAELASAFLAAGASSVVWSDADLPIEATGLWLERFQERLRLAGQSPSAALAGALADVEDLPGAHLLRFSASRASASDPSSPTRQAVASQACRSSRSSERSSWYSCSGWQPSRPRPRLARAAKGFLGIPGTAAGREPWQGATSMSRTREAFRHPVLGGARLQGPAQDVQLFFGMPAVGARRWTRRLGATRISLAVRGCRDS